MPDIFSDDTTEKDLADPDALTALTVVAGVSQAGAQS
jgi:hypothetical protein